MRLEPLLASGIGILAAALVVAACASDTTPPADPPNDDPSDAAADVVEEPDAAEAPCDDCEYFPEECGADILCPSVTFGSGSPGIDIDPRTQINTIQGRSPSDVWAMGALGAAAHFDGTSWSRSELGGRETMRAIWLREAAEVSLGTFTNIYTRGITIEGQDAGASAGGWLQQRPVGFPPFSDYNSMYLRLTAAWGAPDSERLWVTTTTYRTAQFSGLWRLWIMPSGQVLVEVGIPRQICRDNPCSQLTHIHGTSRNDVWAVGYRGAAVHITDADTPNPVMTAFNTRTFDAFFGVWASSPSDVWAVGTNGTIRHYDGDPSVWQIVTDVPTTTDLIAVGGSSPSDIWAVGEKGVALHFDGKTWSRVAIAGLGKRRPTLTAVWVPAPGHVWIGGQGVLLSLGGKP